MDLRFENVATTEQFATLLRDLGVPTPWAYSEDGGVFASNRAVVLQVDPNGEMPDAPVAAIAALLVVAVNTCAGLKAVRS